MAGKGGGYTLNTDSILNKIDKAVRNKRTGAQKQCLAIVDGAILSDTMQSEVQVSTSIDEVVTWFIQRMQENIARTVHSDNVVQAISNLEIVEKKRISEIRINNKITYSIGINFSGSLGRDSLVPDRYPGGIDNLAKLFNNGAKHGERMNRVYGIWHDQRVGSRTVIPPAHFVQETCDAFRNEMRGLIEIQDIIIDSSWLM